MYLKNLEFDWASAVFITAQWAQVLRVVGAISVVKPFFLSEVSYVIDYKELFAIFQFRNT